MICVQAGRVMLRELARHFAARESFAFETTLAGRGCLRLIDTWQAAGYRVKLIFLKLENVEDAIARVAQRVRQGGHDIPEHVIRRRFAVGLKNFENLCAPKLDSWALYDNIGAQPVLLHWSERPCTQSPSSWRVTTILDCPGLRTSEQRCARAKLHAVPAHLS